MCHWPAHQLQQGADADDNKPRSMVATSSLRLRLARSSVLQLASSTFTRSADRLLVQNRQCNPEALLCRVEV